MNPVGWFEIPVLDMDRAIAFYEAVFQQKLERHELGPIEMAWWPFQEGAIGCTGSLVKGEFYKPSHEGSMVYFTASDIEETFKRAVEAGGSVLKGVTDIGDYGFVAHIEDTEGNRIALHRRKS